MSWQKEVAVKDLDPAKNYFFASKHEHPPGHFGYNYYSRDKRGKKYWSTKPGIAMHCIPDEKFLKALAESPNHVALEIPADHSKRWSRR